MIKRLPLWLKVGLSSVFLIYASTALLFFMVEYSLGGLTFFDILIDSLLQPFFLDKIIVIAVPLCAFVIGAVIGLISEKFFIINIKEKFHFPMIKRMPLWLKIGLSFAFWAYISMTLAFFIYAIEYFRGGANFFDVLLRLFYGGEIIVIAVSLAAFVIGTIIGLIYEKFFITNITRKKK